MANPKHVKWLLEGVKAWNPRRQRDDFTPDLQGANLQKANLQWANLRGAVLQKANLQGADLQEANLWEADLRKANLWKADLRKANMWKADLDGADLDGANLQEADLRGAYLRGANLQGADLLRAYLLGADLLGADVRSLISLAGQTGAASDFSQTDFRDTRNLTQEQLDTMQGTKGEHGTLLPKGLIAPDHWDDDPMPSIDALPELPTAVDQHEDSNDSADQTKVQILIERARFVVETPEATKFGARMTAQQIDAIVSEHLSSFDQPRNQTPETDLLLAIRKAYLSIADTLDEAIDKDQKIAKLEGQLESALNEVNRLEGIIKNQPSKGSQIVVGALSGAGGAAIIATTGYIFGEGATDVINTIYSFFSKSELSTPTSPHLG